MGEIVSGAGKARFAGVEFDAEGVEIDRVGPVPHKGVVGVDAGAPGGDHTAVVATFPEATGAMVALVMSATTDFLVPPIMFDLCAPEGPFARPVRKDFEVYAIDGGCLARVPIDVMSPSVAMLADWPGGKIDLAQRVQRLGPFGATPIGLPPLADLEPYRCESCAGGGTRLVASPGVEPGPCQYCDGTGKREPGGRLVNLWLDLLVVRRNVAALVRHGARVYPPVNPDAPITPGEGRPGPAFRFTCGRVVGFLLAVGRLAPRVEVPRRPVFRPGGDR